MLLAAARLSLDARKSEENGRGTGIRTPDPLLPKQVLYQAELCPDTSGRCNEASSPDDVCVPSLALNVKHGERFWLEISCDKVAHSSFGCVLAGLGRPKMRMLHQIAGLEAQSGRLTSTDLQNTRRVAM
jgi:hypothetical protein